MNKLKSALHQIIHSLMMQLTFHHFKKNLALLAVWFIIIAAFTGGLGRVYGIHYLFLDPEYLGKVGFWSFFIVGIAFGNLIMSWHITTYILDGHRFRFIGTLQRPFTKFSINNSLIPLLILIIYIIFLVRFQVENGLAERFDIFLFVVGLILGIICMHLLMILYFRFTNKDIFIFLAGSLDKRLRKSGLSRDRVMKKIRENKADEYNVTNYLDLNLKPRSTEHIINFGSREAIVRVFDQNHFNSVVVELFIIGVILLLGFFMNIEFLQIPAAASSLLIFAIAVMLVGAISYWFKGWGLAFALGIFVLVNTGVKTGFGKGVNQATGLNYDTAKTEYTIENLARVHSSEQYVHDKLHMLETLENWKAKWKNPKDQKMVFLCVSGGGQRAALWTVNTLLRADSVLNGTLMDQTFLITGASGGVIGAAYYREVQRRNSKVALSDMGPELRTRIGKDNLNPVIFGLLVNDLFFKIRKHEYAGRTYSVDRGFVFEKNLDKNLGHILDKQINDYQEPEAKAETPTLIMSPTIANDGRKLYISSQPISYMGVSSSVLDGNESKIRGVDFQALFSQNEAENLSFLTALRMSASFPYITPNISLPAEPRVEIMDAGISDNFGVSDAIRFVNVFKDWIAENTGGVVFLVVRDTKSNAPIEKRPNPSVIDRLTYPIASVYNNLTNMQDINNDFRLEQMKLWFDGDFDVVEVAYDSFEKDKQVSEVERASLSWHLTTKEKQHIINNINIESNKQAIQKLQDLLKSSSNP
ncbi:patatin-like phospholipase family protein [Ekhidna sp. MALMAid0563]|uniref:patatin-like phospholipase family protein n=1 Tax=Ekhidna sp. MALMAid0563 TaxID=3143937 RepID=UPI0032DF605A